jgi:hypothetical protein
MGTSFAQGTSLVHKPVAAEMSCRFSLSSSIFALYYNKIPYITAVNTSLIICPGAMSEDNNVSSAMLNVRNCLYACI